MNGVLTKKEAVRKHKAMWKWIADYIEEKKRVQCIPELKTLYLKEHNETPSYLCYCCEYDEQLDDDCEFCPVIWGSNSSCYSEKSLYRQCMSATTWQKQANLARLIANLPEREDDPGIDIL